MYIVSIAYLIYYLLYIITFEYVGIHTYTMASTSNQKKDNKKGV